MYIGRCFILGFCAIYSKHHDIVRAVGASGGFRDTLRIYFRTVSLFFIIYYYSFMSSPYCQTCATHRIIIYLSLENSSPATGESLRKLRAELFYLRCHIVIFVSRTHCHVKINYASHITQECMILYIYTYNIQFNSIRSICVSMMLIYDRSLTILAKISHLFPKLYQISAFAVEL